MSDAVNIHEAKTHFSKLVGRAEAGEDIVIARNGRPVARLTALAAPQPAPVRRPGGADGEIEMGDDFDEPMPEAWLREHGFIG